MLSKVLTGTIVGLDALPIQVEVDIASGLPNMTIVGLPDASIQEARERVKSAIKNSNIEFPMAKIVANLSPAHLRKEGSGFDAPLALAVLAAFKKVVVPPKSMTVGELSLAGDLKPIKGMLAIASLVKKLKLDLLIIPKGNAAEANFIKDIKVLEVTNLKEIVDFLNRPDPQKVYLTSGVKSQDIIQTKYDLDMADIKGNLWAKKALEISASGGHNVLLYGPPGTGKSMLAQALLSILPGLTPQEMIEVNNIYSICGLIRSSGKLIYQRPFRSPHHTSSTMSIIGGGSIPKPGEISLAHRGILFLDEFPEFDQSVIEALREPMQEGRITIARARSTVTFPAQTTLIAAMNPCPCGYYGSHYKHCSCSQAQIRRYAGKVSGPISDRIDTYIRVDKTKADQPSSQNETSSIIKNRVIKARQSQLKRQGELNAFLNKKQTEKIELTLEARKYLNTSFSSMNLSYRSYDKIKRLARTIADLQDSFVVGQEHIMQALQLRKRDII